MRSGFTYDEHREAHAGKELPAGCSWCRARMDWRDLMQALREEGRTGKVKWENQRAGEEYL